MIPWLSSRPAYPDPTPRRAQSPTLTQTCASPGCDHLWEAWRPDGSPPAMIWRGPGCYAAWLASRGGPMVSSVAKVEPPAVRAPDPELSWLGRPLPRRAVSTYDEVAS